MKVRNSSQLKIWGKKNKIVLVLVSKSDITSASNLKNGHAAFGNLVVFLALSILWKYFFTMLGLARERPIFNQIVLIFLSFEYKNDARQPG